MVEIEALSSGAAPVVADEDDTLFRDALVIEYLDKRIGLLAVVIATWVSGFRGSREAEEIGKDHRVA